jgi:hypothetical protein
MPRPAAGLACVHPRPYRVTTGQDKASQRGLVDLVGRQFVPDSPDEVWYGDITYIKTITGWAYMAAVIDGYPDKVIGWSAAAHQRQDLALDALAMAIAAVLEVSRSGYYAWRQRAPSARAAADAELAAEIARIHCGPDELMSTRPGHAEQRISRAGRRPAWSPSVTRTSSLEWRRIAD